MNSDTVTMKPKPLRTISYSVGPTLSAGSFHTSTDRLPLVMVASKLRACPHLAHALVFIGVFDEFSCPSVPASYPATGDLSPCAWCLLTTPLFPTHTMGDSILPIDPIDPIDPIILSFHLYPHRSNVTVPFKDVC